VWLHNRLGLALRWRGQLERAEQVLGTAGALNVGPAQDLGELRFTLNALGLVHDDLGRRRDAKLAFERSAALARADLDGRPDGGPTATALLRRGRRLLEEGSAPEAASLLREAAGITRRLFGAGHPERGLCLELLGRVEAARGGTGRACVLLRAAYRIDAAWFGEHHPRTAADLDAMGVALARVHGPGARGLLRSAIGINEAALGPESLEVAANLVNLAEALGAGGEPEQVKAWLAQADRSTGRGWAPPTSAPAGCAPGWRCCDAARPSAGSDGPHAGRGSGNVPGPLGAPAKSMIEHAIGSIADGRGHRAETGGAR
jgi:tetratricopeptide (TPR) repeat protein